MLYSALSNPSDTHTLHAHPCFHPIFLGIVGFLVYIGCKCISSHHPHHPFLTLDFTGRLALKTPDKQNNIIKLVLPYVVISFKVHAIVSSVRLASHVPQYSLSLHETITSLLLPNEWDQHNIVSLEPAHGQYCQDPAGS
jgi:hypothetical protein